MNKIIYILVFILILASLVIYIQASSISSYKKRLDTEITNVNTLMAQNDTLKTKAGILYLSVDRLSNTKDSLLNHINYLNDSLKIKRNKIKELQYQISTISKKDTIIFSEPIFRDSTFKIDTTLNSKWYNLKVHLEYPSLLVVNPTFKSERLVTMSLNRETINPPSKCWLIRLFQRKHDVMVVDIYEGNPYIEIEQQRYIKIVE